MKNQALLGTVRITQSCYAAIPFSPLGHCRESYVDHFVNEHRKAFAKSDSDKAISLHRLDLVDDTSHLILIITGCEDGQPFTSMMFDGDEDVEHGVYGTQKPMREIAWTFLTSTLGVN